MVDKQQKRVIINIVNNNGELDEKFNRRLGDWQPL